MTAPTPAGQVRVPRNWGATPAETHADYPCDRLVPRPAEVWFRAVTVQAQVSAVFRWLCQLKIAPYSYDLVDNFGRRSPRALSEGAERLVAGQRVMTIFELVDFAPDDHLTIRMDTPRAVALFGDFTVSYVVRPQSAATTRLVAKLVLSDGGTMIAAMRRRVLVWGDLLMMRRQLLTLRDLAERSARPT